MKLQSYRDRLEIAGATVMRAGVDPSFVGGQSTVGFHTDLGRPTHLNELADIELRMRERSLAPQIDIRLFDFWGHEQSSSLMLRQILGGNYRLLICDQ